MEDLFNDHAAYARGSDPGTSHAAARSVNITKSEGRVLSFLAKHDRPEGWTANEMASAGAGATGGMGDLQGLTPRSKPLMKKGLIVYVGKRAAKGYTQRTSSEQRAYRLAPGVLEGGLSWLVQTTREKLTDEQKMARLRAQRVSFRKKEEEAHAKAKAASERVQRIEQKIAALEAQRGDEQVHEQMQMARLSYGDY